jgi:hypothetical protein
VLVKKYEECELEKRLSVVDFEQETIRLCCQPHIFEKLVDTGWIKVQVNESENVQTNILKRINEVLRQGSQLSHICYTRLIDDVIGLSRQTNHNQGILRANSGRFAQHQITIGNGEDLLKATHRLIAVAEVYNLLVIILRHKTNIIPLRGKHQLIARIVMFNKPILKVTHFSYLDCIVSISENKDLESELSKCN